MLAIGITIVCSCLIGVAIDRSIRYDSLTVSLSITTGPTFRLPRGTVLVFYPGFDQTLNISAYKGFYSPGNVTLSQYSEGGVELSLPNLTKDSVQPVTMSGIPFSTGLEVIQGNWEPPVYYASIVQNLSVTLDGVVTCSTIVATVPCESYTLYYGQNSMGYNDYRGFEGVVNLIMFATLGVIVGGILLSWRRHKPVEYVPFITLAILAISSFLYVYSDFSGMQANITSLPLWARVMFPFTHSGFNHYFGNIPYFVVIGASVELVSRRYGARFPLALSFMIPFVVYYASSVAVGGYGLSTLIGALATGQLSYFFVVYWNRENSGTKDPKLGTGCLIVLGVASGLALDSVVFGWAVSIAIWAPFNSEFTLSEGIWHLIVAAISGGLSYLFWKRWIETKREHKVSRVASWLFKYSGV